MAKNVYVFLADGFEEIEAISIIDLLRRAGLTTITVSVGDSLEVSGAHHIPVIADKAFSDLDFSAADALVLPGGLPGVTNLNEHEPLKQLLNDGYASGKLIAAVCAAPMILGQLGIVRGKRATCYPSFEEHLEGYLHTEELVVVDGNVITGAGVGVAMEFALAIVAYLVGSEVADSVADAILLQRNK